MPTPSHVDIRPIAGISPARWRSKTKARPRGVPLPASATGYESHAPEPRNSASRSLKSGPPPRSLPGAAGGCALRSARTGALSTALRSTSGSAVTFQFKNAVRTLASQAAVLVPDDPDRAIEIFSQLLKAIKRVRYYRSEITRASQPGITQRPPNKWCSGRQEKLKNA